MMIFERTRQVCFVLSLVFFFLMACRTESSESHTVSILIENGNPAGFVLPLNMVGPDEGVIQSLSVHVKGKPEPVLGNFSLLYDQVFFHSLVNPTAGMTYEIRKGNKVMGEITIPIPDNTSPPYIMEVYPLNDTLPENLLKFYLEFNMPIQEGNILEHVSLLNKNGDTLKNVFLDLQPELWNADRTVLTLWLDPGRIKRDLQPNLLMGPPLRKDEEYRLVIGKGIRGQNGLELRSDFFKTFQTSIRDSLSPGPENWQIDIPAKESPNPLIIDFNESLDHMLAMNAVRILGKNNEQITGHTELRDEDKLLFFFSDKPWEAGNYHLYINEQLEDLAGNNLKRVFDNNIEYPKESPLYNFSRTFTIR